MRYNIIFKKLSFLFLALALSTTFVSCEQEESVADDNPIAIEDLVSAWVVDVYADGDEQAHDVIINTYNTNTNATDAMWVDDNGEGWGLKAKVNLDGMTFSGTDLDELYYGVTVTITEGSIVKNGTTTPSGRTADSISFKAEFSDLPGVIWEYTGFKYTGLVEDL